MEKHNPGCASEEAKLLDYTANFQIDKKKNGEPTVNHPSTFREFSKRRNDREKKEAPCGGLFWIVPSSGWS